MLRPEGAERYRVLVLHGEVEGVFPFDRSGAEYGGALLGLRGAVGAASGATWRSGHYHVQHQVAPRVWYAGVARVREPQPLGRAAWTSPTMALDGKGWLLVDLDRGTVERQPVPLAREILDLEPIEAEGLSGRRGGRLIAERVAAIPGGVTDKIVRLRVHNIPRHVARELDHAAIRALKTAALHFHLDLRRPEIHRDRGRRARPAGARPCPSWCRSYLERRPLPAELDREAFVRLGERADGQRRARPGRT